MNIRPCEDVLIGSSWLEGAGVICGIVWQRELVRFGLEELLETLRRLELVRQQQSLLLQRGYKVLEKLKLVLQTLQLGRQMVTTMRSVSMQRGVATGAGHE